jgi:hypothetical protein
MRLDESTQSRPDVIVLQTDEQVLRWTPRKAQGGEPPRKQAVADSRRALLPEIIAGLRPGRTREDQLILFGGFGGFGPGTAYAAVGSVLLERARERGIGRELPSQWFIQSESS